MSDLPNLATSAPLWLSLLTVFINAVVGGARARVDASQPWDIVGLTVFALLMGLGGGFIRDVLIGNLPAESLRTPWALCTVIAAMLVVLALGPHLDRLRSLMGFLNAVAMGLFAVSGAAYALAFELPAVSAVLVGTVSAVGGGVLVSALQAQVSSILVASTPNALIALTGALTFVVLAYWSAPLAAICGMAAVMVAQYFVNLTGLQTRPVVI